MADRRKINNSNPIQNAAFCNDSHIRQTAVFSKGDILHPFIFHAKPIFFYTELYFFTPNHFNHAKHPRFNC
jgi:hypothetical protein